MNLIILLLPFQLCVDYYSDNRISSSACGRGYTGVANTGDISSVFINPASLSLENKRQYYFEYTYKNNVELGTNSTLQELHPNFSAGYAFFINEFFQIGMTYRTEKSFSTDAAYLLGHLLGSSTNDPDRFEYLKSLHLEIYDDEPWSGPSDSSDPSHIGDLTSDDKPYINQPYDLYTDMKISSFSIPIAVNFKNIVRIGLDINYTTFYLKSETQTISENIWIINSAPIKFSKIIPKFGFIYSPMENLSFGLTYTPKISESISSYYYTLGLNISPTKIGIGVNYKFNSFPLTLSLDYIRSHNSIEANLINRNDIHLGLEYDLNNNLKLRTGLFTQRDYRTGESRENSEMDNFDQIFNTFGISYKISSFVLNLSLMDSHLFSNSPIEQTYFSTGISYGF